MSNTDGPIVAAVRRARALIADECGGDLARLFERLRAIEVDHQKRATSEPTVPGEKQPQVRSPRGD